MMFKVNGKAYVDHSVQDRTPCTPFSGEFRFKAPLKAGWNKIEVKVASGSDGFGFWAQVSDPGDLAVSLKPQGAPKVPVGFEYADEPHLENVELFYVRPFAPADDPYRFNPY